MAREIEGTSKAESVMGRWAANDLAFIERLEFGAGPNSTASVKLVALFQSRALNGWPAIDKPMYRVTMLFDDVQGLELKSIGGPQVQVMGFDIRPIGDRGWEGMSFEVEDYEDGRIRFLCGRARILEIEDPKIA